MFPFFTGKEHVFSYFRAVLWLHWHWKIDLEWIKGGVGLQEETKNKKLRGRQHITIGELRETIFIDDLLS